MQNKMHTLLCGKENPEIVHYDKMYSSKLDIRKGVLLSALAIHKFPIYNQLKNLHGPNVGALNAESPKRT